MGSNIALPFQLTKTVACALYEMQAISGVTPQYHLDTTINAKYNNFPTVPPSSPPKIGYFGIGLNGFRNLNDQNLQAPFIPISSDLDLYKSLPFRVVPVGSDLTVAERANYRMRVPITAPNGQTYWAYYFKVLSFVNNQVQIIQTDIATGVETALSDFDPLNLNPTPGNTTAEGIQTATTKISVALTASIQITGAEVIEAINVLYGGNLLMATISEVGIYLGNDQQVTMNDGVGGTFNGTEAICASLAYHYTSLGTSYGTPEQTNTMGLRINSANAFLLV